MVAPIAALIAVTVADIATGKQAVLVGLLSIAPLLSGVSLPPRATARISAAAVSVAALAFLWNDTWSGWAYWVPLSVVALASVFAVVMAGLRERLDRETSRLRVLARLGQVAYGDASLAETAKRIVDAAVPGGGDFALIEVLGEDGRFDRIAGSITRNQRSLAALLDRSGRSGSDSDGEPPTERTVSLREFDERGLLTIARDSQDLELVRALSLSSAVRLPLSARGRMFGALTLGFFAPQSRWEETLAFAETLSGRVALALSNAALAAELAGAEKQLDAILATVDGAIIVRDIHGEMVYANQAAADLLRLSDPEAIAALRSGEAMQMFDVYSERGDLVELADLPGARVLAGETNPPPMIVRNVVRATGEERWLVDKATAIRDEQARVVMAVNLVEDITATKRAELAQRLLATTGRRATEGQDTDSTLQAMADAAVPELADWAGVDLLEPDGTIRTVAVAHSDPAKVKLGWQLRTRWPVARTDPDGLAAVIRTGEAQLVHDITEEMLEAGAADPEHLLILRQVGLRSTMVVPLRAPDGVLGALSFVSSTARRFDASHLALAEDLGRQAGVIVRDARLLRERAEIARTLEDGLLPQTLPKLPGWSVSAAYSAASGVNQVGGDFYDLVTFDERWAAIIGDVVGKGAPAAALTALVRHTLVAAIRATGDGGRALEITNARMCETDELNLCTVALVIGDGRGTLTVYRAGHPAPLLARKGQVREVGATGTLLGLEKQYANSSETVVVEPGDQILLFTDGVTEARRGQEFFGEDRLHEAVRETDVTLAPSIMDQVRHFAGEKQSDDIALLALCRDNLAAPKVPPPSAVEGSERSPSAAEHETYHQ